jgi:molecular chaperone DnaJ
VVPHSIFHRNGSDIITEVNISLTKAVLGGDISVSTLGGKVDMKVPAGTQSESIFRLKGKGIVDLHGRGMGDQLVKVIVEIPRRLTADQRRLMEEFARLSGETVDRESFADKIKKSFK